MTTAKPYGSVAVAERGDGGDAGASGTGGILDDRELDRILAHQGWPAGYVLEIPTLSC